MRVAALTKQNRHGTGAFGNLIFVHRAGGNIDTGRRDDLVRFPFEDDLSFEAGEIRMIADEVIKFVCVVTVRHLIIRHRRRQILRFVNRHVNIGFRVRIAIDKNMEKLVDKAKKISIGNGLKPGVLMGPLHTKEQRQEVEEQVEDAVKRGGKVIFGGQRPKGDDYDKGFYLQPTLVADVDPASRMFLGIGQRARPGEIAPRHPRAGQPCGNAETRRSECRALDVRL